ncbi:C3 and PZP-like alpha-2-macroglobulin domain-containing protein 8 isoform X2 [Paroedura picta]|uniref:C3 and PZP-like alpha-2-macroglobulin domain-containing protein 8 isoform X2 n=1 Tax=Paroedura picta TaxID=143630 RepID=UPI0040577A6E
MPGRRAGALLVAALLGSVCGGGGGGSLARGYLVAAPSVFRAGVEEAISVTIFKQVKETTVQVQLVVKGETVARSHGTVLGKGTIALKVPTGLRGQAQLKVWGNRHLTEEGYIFHNYTTVTIDSKGASVFIQTDKPVYRPKQKVLINLFTIGPNLRPINERVEAYVLDPRGSRMIEWNNLKPICCGVLNMSFPLSDQPVFGEWFIFAEMQGHVYNGSFEVQKYVLPKFELWIEPPRYIRDLSTCEKGMVHARYTFGKPVAGRLTVNMTVNGVGYYRHEVGTPVLKTSEIDGSARFDVCVGDMMPVDIPEHFRGVVSIWATVTGADGTKQATFDDSTPVQKQLVDIKYTKDTRKQFKPGLPYKGKVEVTYPDGSPADGVTVRIKAELTPQDNIYTSEQISSRGLVAFEIPSIPAAAQYVWLETKVTAFGGKPVGDQYLPNYLSITSWYSPSKCHLQLQMLNKPFLVDEEASIAVLSTCPCNFSLHYEVVSRGNIVLSGLQPQNVTQQRSRRAVAASSSSRSIHMAHSPAPTGSPPAAETNACMTSLRFRVTHSMAPLGRLLVYYVREDGEGVTDSLQFAIKPSFENQVSVTFSANETRPGDSVGIRVKAAKGSCVCLATVDKTVYLLKPGFQLTPSQIFQELADYDVSDVFGAAKEDGHFWWPGMSVRRRRRRSSIFPWHWDVTKDARFAFTETGLVVMTDLVRLNHRQQGSMYTDEAGPAFQPHTGTLMASTHRSKTVPRAEKKKRIFFPETWLWHCLNVSQGSGEAQLQVEVPDSITTWLTEAVGMSEERGMGVAGQASLKTFKAFFIEFTLPYRVIRGEQTKIPLTVNNYMAVCLEVHVKIAVPKGIKFVGHPGKHHLTRKKCVAPGEAKPTSVVLSFSKLGQNNITAKAFAYGGSSCCQDGLQFAKSGKHADDFYLDRQAPVGVDYVRRSILVEPEGLTREYTYSVFFCPNEKIHISTPNKYEYQYVQKPSRMTHFSVAVKAHHSAHIALSSSPHDMTAMTEIVLGGHQNSRTWISASKMGEPVASAETPGLLSWDEFRTFWISWTSGLIQVGHGPSVLNESIIVSWAAPRPPEVKYVGFSTGWGSAGEYKIWRKEEADENHNEAFTLGVPHNVIPGSEKATASVIGDVMGPTLNNLDNLLQLPFGCGEQNMIHFAPNVFVLKYLQKTKQLSPEVESEATDYLIQGYQRQLTYKRQDGSYSAFGERDSSGSMWLTAFVLKSFAQSHGFIFIDPKELLVAKNWIIQHQKEEGSFPAVGRILNKDIQGGIHGKISLTAYVVAALLETGVISEDTCVALQALAEYAILSYTGGVNLTVSLASTNLDYQETFELNKANKKLLQSTVIPSIPTGLFVSARGEGCCLLQIDVSYNVPDPVANPAFQLLVNLQEPKPKRHRRAPPAPKSVSPDKNRSEAFHREAVSGDDDDPASDQDQREYKLAVEACVRWLHSGSSNMAVLEVPLLSGFQADIESLEQLLMNKQIGLKRYEVDGRKVLFYFDEIPSQCMTCVNFMAFREYIVGKTAPVPIKVYDYYEPAFEATRFYNISENSPLARELCDGPLCNEVESAAGHWVGFVPAGPCNSVLGCLEDGHFEQCLCARDCGYDGDLVCGSDGLLYQNRCQMEVAACRNATRLTQVSMAQCTGGAKNTPEGKEKTFHTLRRPAQLQQMLTDEGPTLQLDFSYYAYEYEVEPYASEGDAFEQTTPAQATDDAVGLL